MHMAKAKIATKLYNDAVVAHLVLFFCQANNVLFKLVARQKGVRLLNLFKMNDNGHAFICFSTCYFYVLSFVTNMKLIFDICSI